MIFFIALVFGGEVEVLAPKAVVSGPSGCVLVVNFEIGKGMHIQANPAARPNLIPATLTVKGGVSASVKYPKAMPFRLRDGTTLAVYGGELALPVTLRPKSNGPHFLDAMLRYQACTDTVCLRPKDLPFSISLRVDLDEPVVRGGAPMCKAGS